METYTLKRSGSCSAGTFGYLWKMFPVALTLEPEVPVIPAGVYLCELYTSGRHPYPVFKLKDVPGHDYIEIHIGNKPKDTQGCILIGQGLSFYFNGISDSSICFTKFMKNQKENFLLRVE